MSTTTRRMSDASAAADNNNGEQHQHLPRAMSPAQPAAATHSPPQQQSQHHPITPTTVINARAQLPSASAAASGFVNAIAAIDETEGVAPGAASTALHGTTTTTTSVVRPTPLSASGTFRPPPKRSAAVAPRDRANSLPGAASGTSVTSATHGGDGGGGGDSSSDHDNDDDKKKKPHDADDAASSNAVFTFFAREGWIDKKEPLKGLREDIFAGLTLTMTQVPPAVAFSLIAHVQPLTGLFSSFFIGVIMSIFGGRPGSISAAAGALAVVYPSIVDPYGEDALFLASIIAGVLFMLPGLFGVAKYVRLVPASVMLGFVDGLAIVLFRGQISAFRDANGEYVTGRVAGLTAFLTIFCFGIMMLFPKVTTLIPSTFVAIVVGTALEHIFQMGTVTVGDLYNVAGEFPTPRAPSVTSDATGTIISHGFIIAIIGLVESLLTVHVVNVMTETKGSFEREAISMGAANIVCGFFGCYAGCAVIGPTILNFHSGGGRRRVSAFITGLMMIVVVLAAYPAVNWLPMGALSAVLFGICVKTFDWRTFEMIFCLKVPVQDSIVILVVTIVTVFTDLAIAVGCGIGVALLFFAFDFYSARGVEIVKIETEVDPVLAAAGGPSEALVIHLKGTLFFLSASEVYNKIEALHHDGKDNGCSDVILDFGCGACTIHDFSVIDSLNETGTLYTRHGRRLHLRNLDRPSEIIVERSLNFAVDIHNDDPAAVEEQCVVSIPSETKRERMKKEALAAQVIIAEIRKEHEEALQREQQQQGDNAIDKKNDNKNDDEASTDVPDGSVAVQGSGKEPLDSTVGSLNNTALNRTSSTPNAIIITPQQRKRLGTRMSIAQIRTFDEDTDVTPTVAELLAEAKITVFVHSKKLGVNVPLKAFTPAQLKAGTAVDKDVVAPAGFEMASRFRNILLVGRNDLKSELIDEFKKELIALV